MVIFVAASVSSIMYIAKSHNVTVWTGCNTKHWLTHWGRVTHLCVSKLTSIASDNGLSPGRRQVIIWTNARILLIGPLRTNFSEILCEIHTFSFNKMRLLMSSGKWRPFCLGLNVFIKCTLRFTLASYLASRLTCTSCSPSMGMVWRFS